MFQQLMMARSVPLSESVSVGRTLSSWNEYVMDDAELLKDLIGLDKPPLFDENDTDVSLFPVSEDDSILLRHMDVVDTSPDKCV